MATYATVVSLMNVLNQIQHQTCPVAFDQTQIQSLFGCASWLVDFLEAYSQNISPDLEAKMVHVTSEVEDTIESYLVDGILAGSGPGGNIGDEIFAIFRQDLEKAIQELDIVIQEAREVKDMDQAEPRRFEQVVSLAPTPSGNKKMVGLQDQVLKLLDQLTSYESQRQIIPIVGMAGIGKTTLALNVYNHPLACECFDIRAWVTVSQNVCIGAVFRTLLIDIDSSSEIGDTVSDVELQERVYKMLFGRKYLIILDDIWTSDAWDMFKRYFPENGNGSRVVLTTRSEFVDSGSSSYNMKLLDDDTSWNLLSETIFGSEVLPPELEKLGMQIAKGCTGLPLSIVVVGGLLKMSEKTPEYWDIVAKDVISIMHAEERWLKVISLSYNYLPIHLKPCFLYMATFPEDHKINASELVSLWVADGLLKPDRNKGPEEIAVQCLNDLISRNLVMVPPVRSDRRGRKRYCSIHDSVRELCLREAQDQRFVSLWVSDGFSSRNKSPEEIAEQYIDGLISRYIPLLNVDRQRRKESCNSVRRFVHHLSEFDDSWDPTSPMPLGRSYYCYKWGSSPRFTPSKLLRVLHVFSNEGLSLGAWQLVNLRYLACRFDENGGRKFLSAMSLFWNLQAITVDGNLGNLTLPSEVWKLVNLKSLVFNHMINLPNPVGDCIILDNLQTLEGIKNFKFTTEVRTRLPNVKRLGVYYDPEYVLRNPHILSQSFANLALHSRIESLTSKFKYGKCVFNELDSLRFSVSLRELELQGSRIPWSHMNIVGSLPNLQVLTLLDNAFVGGSWKSTEEGEFPKLKCLTISSCELTTWESELSDSHFPELEQLYLECLELEEIPKDIGEETLELINLETHKRSLVLSAKGLLEDREENGCDNLVVAGDFFMPNIIGDDLWLWKTEIETMRTANSNFRVQIRDSHSRITNIRSPITSLTQGDITFDNDELPNLERLWTLFEEKLGLNDWRRLEEVCLFLRARLKDYIERRTLMGVISEPVRHYREGGFFMAANDLIFVALCLTGVYFMFYIVLFLSLINFMFFIKGYMQWKVVLGCILYLILHTVFQQTVVMLKVAFILVIAHLLPKSLEGLLVKGRKLLCQLF